MSHLPTEIELQIDSMAQGGDGVGRHDGRVVFAEGALPGERVRVRLHEQKARHARGCVVEVLAPAAERVAPRLPGADHMPWQHIDYTAQVRFKQAILREQLAKLAGIVDAPVADSLPAASPWGYRNTAHMRIHRQTGRIGYHAADSHTVVDVSSDPLLLPALNEVLAGLRSALADANSADTRSLSAVTLRGSETYGYAVAIAHMHEPGDPPLMQQWCARVPALAAVASDAAPESRAVREPAVTLHERLGGVVFSLAPESFFQANTSQAEVLLHVVRDLLDLRPHEHLLDAYSGVGAFALPLAALVQRVTAVEAHRQAVFDGERTARLHGIDTVRFVAAPVERALPDLLTAPPVDAVILDPPRRGCHPAALDALVAAAPARIAYVSCQPAILARDARRLMEGGYRLQAVQPVDMFPQTPHIECVALLVRGT